jgi:hypothetical protein
MAEDEEWRVTTTLRSTDDASRLQSHLSDAEENAVSSISLVGVKLYGYGSSQGAVEATAARIRAVLDVLSIDPSGIEVDKWLPDQEKWGDPAQAPPEKDSDDDPPKKQGWISTMIDGLTGGIP